MSNKIVVLRIRVAGWCIGKETEYKALTAIRKKLHTVFINAGNNALARCGDGFCLVHFEQIQHQFFVLLPLTDQLTIGSSVAHITQNHQCFSCAELVTNADFDGIHRTCVGCCIPGIIDVEPAGTDGCAICSGNLHLIMNGVAIVFHGNRHFSSQIFGDLTGCYSTVGKCYSYFRTNG